MWDGTLETLATCAAVAAALVALLLLRLWSVLPGGGPERPLPATQKVRCLVVLGSGGHTAEMLYDLGSLPVWRERFQPAYLVAATDFGSGSKAEAFERRGGASQASVVRVPRAREVGQSYASSVLTTLRAGWHTLRAVVQLMPDVVFANGPGTCVPVVASAYLLRILGLRQTRVIYSESFACVDHLSLSGRLLYRLADRFTVQWPELLSEYPRALYAGRMHSEQEVSGCRDGAAAPQARGLRGLAKPPLVSTPTAIVTVGSTRFDALIRAIDDPAFMDALAAHGIRRLKVQLGAGEYRPQRLVDSRIEVEVTQFVEDLPSQLQQASLVISHAGAGTILDCLMTGQRLVVVPNEGLMANHQVQLGMALHEQRVLLCFRVGELIAGLKAADFDALLRFPPRPSPVFARCVEELVGLGKKEA